MKLTFHILFFIHSVLCFSQTNFEFIEMSNSSPFLLGEVNQEILESHPNTTWFKKGFESYKPDMESINVFKKKLRKHNLILFLGTWCGDSKREVPRILKILKKADFSLDQIKIYALDKRKDNYKKGLNGEEEGWNIIKVPTLIVLKENKEVNRIVENPIHTLEKDLEMIFSGKDYKPTFSVLN